MGGSLWKKLVDGFKAVAHVFPFSEQFIQNGGVGLGGGVQQHHRAVVGSGNKLTESLLLGGPGIVIPVLVGKTPENGLIAQFFRHLQIFFTINSLGRPVVPGKLVTGGIKKQGLQVFQLLGEGIHGGELAHIRVMHSVVAHDMTLVHHPPHQVRVLFDNQSHPPER